MTYQATPLFERDTVYKVSGPTVYILSVVLHIVIIIIVPVLSSIFRTSRKFERPKTFQLVASPLRPAPAPKVPVQKNAIRQRKPQEQRRETPRQRPDSNRPRRQRDSYREQEAARPHENLDELSSLLDEIPSPVQISSSSSNFNHAYLHRVSNKVQQFWQPTKEDKRIKVVVEFTIKRNGSITEPEIKSSSGNRALDNLALRAVKIAAPFPPLPRVFKDDVNITLNLIPTRK